LTEAENRKRCENWYRG